MYYKHHHHHHHHHHHYVVVVVVVIAQQLFSYRQLSRLRKAVPQVLHCKLRRMALTVEQMLYVLRTNIIIIMAVAAQ